MYRGLSPYEMTHSSHMAAPSPTSIGPVPYPHAVWLLVTLFHVEKKFQTR